MDEPYIDRLKDVTFLFHIKLNTSRQVKNLNIVLDFLTLYFDSPIHILETGNSQFLKNIRARNIQYEFKGRNEKLFNHAPSINYLVEKVNTPIIACWDENSIVDPDKIREVVQCLREKKCYLGIPHNQYITQLPVKYSSFLKRTKLFDNLIKENYQNDILYNPFATSNLFLADTSKFIEAGAENEYITGTRSGNLERIKRVEILYSKNIYYTSGNLFHLGDAENIKNSLPFDIKDQLEYLNICRMNPSELHVYINQWPWKNIPSQHQSTESSNTKIVHSASCKLKKYRLIAYYLPQFHPIPENDKWWGKGFTEWTNVGKTKPLFRQHYQPRVPADLGYYDLRLPDIRKEQARLAGEAGIEGFCYWHYWFGNKKRLLERPFQEVLESGEPNFPFCLAWANESWRGMGHGIKNNTILIEQNYTGFEDYKFHFKEVLPAFKDSRYIRVNNKPLFVIYKPLLFKDVHFFIELWQKLATENGLPGIYFVAHTENINEKASLLKKGFESINIVRLFECIDNKNIYPLKKGNLSQVYKYADVYPTFVGKTEKDNEVIPTIIPNWDHSPRSGNKSYILHQSTPDLFKKHLKQVLDAITEKPDQERIAFIKSWNEWGEGNYLEPDLVYGKSYLNAIRECLTHKK